MPTVLPPGADLALKMETERLSLADLALAFGVTKQAVHARIKRAGINYSTAGYLPWRVPDNHRGRSTFTRCAIAHVKWSRGEAVSAAEQADADNLRRTAALLNSVMIYDHELGFCWRDRRPDDVDIIAAA